MSLFGFHRTEQNSLIKVKINENLDAFFSSDTGLLKEFFVRSRDQLLKSEINIITYGSNRTLGQNSGAYLFMPDGDGVNLSRDFFKWIRVESGFLKSRVCVNLTLILHCVEFYPTLNTKNAKSEYPMFGVWNVVDRINE